MRLKIAYLVNIGCFPYVKIFGNFVRLINETRLSAWKFAGQRGPPPGVVLFDRSVGSNRNLPFHFQKFIVFSTTLRSSNQNFGRNPNGSFQWNNVLSFSFDNSTGFWLFDLAKWKASLVNLPSLKVIGLKRTKMWFPKVAKFYRLTNFCKLLRVCGVISSLFFNKSL